MSARHARISAAGIIAVSAGSIVLAGNRTQPTAPPIPSSGQQSSQNSTGQGNSPSKPQPQTPATPPRGSNTTPNATQPTNQPTQPIPNFYPNPGGTVIGPGAGFFNEPPDPTQNNSRANNNANNNNNAMVPPVAPPPATPKAVPDPVIATPATPPDAELQQATADLNSAMDHLRAGLLKDDLEYQAAAGDKKAAQADIAALRAKDDSPPDAILVAAKRGLDAAHRMAIIEHAAIAKDQLVLDAQAHLKTALAAHNANNAVPGAAAADAAK